VFRGSERRWSVLPTGIDLGGRKGDAGKGRRVGGIIADVGTASAQARDVAVASPATRIGLESVDIYYRIAQTGSSYCAVRGVTFDVRVGEMVCIVGPSGCGKSTILNAIAGLVQYTGGMIVIDGNPVSGPGKNRAMVFQRAALLPWKSVLQNVMFGLRLYGVDKATATTRARAMLEVVGLAAYEDRYPYQLSGGMQQRVNLARALAADPDIVLLDEPFAALDAIQRETLQEELLRIWQASNKTGVFITHQIDEAVLLGDRVIVMSKGPGAEIMLDQRIGLRRPRGDHTYRDAKFSGYVNQIRRALHGDDQ
jgi:NitT/TauT family transport system ATP-binding protein